MTERTYTMGRTDEETQRLIMQAQLYDDSTRRLFEDAGIGPGMRVLDVGSGAGDVAFLVADLVGPEGTVVGFDQNPTVLATARERANEARRRNVTFVEADVESAELPDQVDAVVGRLVLMYLADSRATLRRLVERVRPGGVVAFQEVDIQIGLDYARSCPENAVELRSWEWTYEVVRRSGANPRMGTHLFRLFRDAGLVDTRMTVHAPIGGPPGWIGYPYAVASERSLLPLYELYGIATAEDLGLETLAERLQAEVEASGVPGMLIPLVGAWARKPH
jgi:ubiquinone/menaquinone biosynthesis C-methylase UbiE